METLRFAVIGVGHFGKNYVRLLKELPGATLSATAQSAAEAQAVLQRPDIDAVVIATPPTTHAALAAAALESGKHVLVEKPMVLRMADARMLQKKVGSSRRVLMVGHQYCYNDYIKHLKEEMHRGTLGKVRYVYAEHLYFGPVRSDVGAFWDTATHELAIIDYLFGPCEITDARGSACAIRGGSDDDFAACTVNFSNGMLATIVASRFAPQKVRRMFFGGTDGLAIFDDLEPTEKLKFTDFAYPMPSATPAASSLFFTPSSARVVTPHITAGEPLRHQVEHFIACVRTGASPTTGIEHGLRVTQWLEYIYQRISPAPLNNGKRRKK
ncbi:MAG: Gfo/Idh/MocA family oxidoreductase [Patescibacteria group bacterium]|nr:Gfo/Idh/MocA family oxidoreductase [Patescibacteria group bacterium]